MDNLRKRITQYCFYNAQPDHNPTQQAILAIFDEQAPQAEKIAQQMKDEREAEAKQYPAQFLATLETIQSTYETLQLNPDYQKFTRKKQEMNTKLQNLAKFCTITELTQHPKLSNESKSRLERKIQTIT